MRRRLEGHPVTRYVREHPAAPVLLFLAGVYCLAVGISGRFPIP